MRTPPLDVQAAVRVVSHVGLSDVQFMALGASLVQDRETPPGWKLAWELGPIQATWMRSSDFIQALFPFVVRIEGRSDSGEKMSVAEVSLLVQLHYKLAAAAEVADDDLDHYVGINGYMHAWPYLRAEVQALTTKLGLPPLVLPVQVSGNAAAKVSVGRVTEFGDTQAAGSKAAGEHGHGAGDLERRPAT